ncbi:glycosyltransferase family 4 protein [Azospirillum isscasi]|uniref:Glycosyltransferase family 4 protein n=1 Tax=Azospirillum isscasi TaxID=3053926 RepID=A0ABU0WKU2_9PROT|nr:glycosyltransferase family 4 protein [Azospirillum isscasi]MDQ2104717.1 glycosyltransferase family 4 protein [Azospirillum isscasi]
MRILLLSRYSPRGPSSRLRHYQFLPALAEAGISVAVAPLLPDSYLEALYTGQPRPLRSIAMAYAARIRQMAAAETFDLLWIEKELLPWFPYGAERWILPSAPPYVVDFDDAWFHHYDRSRWPLVRRMLGSKLDRVMRHAALVTVGNDYLAKRAETAGARSVVILPTVVDLARYPAGPGQAGHLPAVGWIGSPITDHYLSLVEEPLRRMVTGNEVRLCLVGATPGALGGLPAGRHAWREDTETRHIAAFDIGIMPLADTPWERGKCGYKLIQYMACGKPVVASPVGVNRDIVEHGVNGFLAETPQEWTDALRRLAASPDLRRRLGAAGRAKVERHYSLAGTAPRLIELLRAAAGCSGNGDGGTTAASGLTAERP